MSNEKHNIQREVREYSEKWHEMMCTIWRDKIDMMGIFDTGALRSSVSPGQLLQDGISLDITFHFLEYGIYVDRGVGNGYKHNNGGDLKILDKAYRYEHHNKNKMRQRRPWFSNSWHISSEVLKDKMVELMGKSFAGAFDNL